MNGRVVELKDHHRVTMTGVPAGEVSLVLHGCDGGSPKKKQEVAAGTEVYFSITGSIGTIHGVEHISIKDAAWWAEKMTHTSTKSLPDVDWSNAPVYVHEEKKHHHHHEHKHHEKHAEESK